MEKYQVKTLISLILFLLLILTGGAIFWQFTIKPTTPPEIVLASPEETPQPESEQIYRAPNGKDTLVVREKKINENTLITFLITNEKEGSYGILSKTLSQNEKILVPYNTFSPDNKYIFLKMEKEGNTNFFAISTANKDSQTESDIKEVVFTKLFREIYPDLKIEDVTGWGGMTLLVINATDNEGKKHSFWYDVPSGQFIPLSSQF
ncbi:hypothetical protein A2382_02920 [Candidatus Woesebacteria bacterium RIFOXYB1_FULL_38_16]|uniref:Uncharacterized protein n=1 Tax=Candidatus Woesebacteria bacterium RIFOXYB1_FULL_38_16 TaxID=1802538 RepID=A0A1F8CTK4_9BACT|nr:MAG: hypothetical protein A2191_04765 [Candidatus Woesebacteria bacterium RIFOXYA1_FULL_38_9]OGM79159.1 MAG: hypothetical protein A2382_02920 [Candidatus Woesebacteria bacterium RIFOXYB1_FULL_38_16]